VSRTSSTDTEMSERLRVTYRTVAAVTEVTQPERGAAPPSVVLGGPTPTTTTTTTPRRGRVAAAVAAAVMVVVAGGVLARWTIGSDAPAAGSTAALAPTLRHAALDRVPAGFGLVEISTTADVDRLVFTDGTRTFRLTTDRAAPSAGPSTGSRLVPVRATVGSIHNEVLTWTERPGVVVVVDGDGGWTDDELIGVAEDVMMVSTTAWTDLVAADGFESFGPVDGVDRAVFDPAFPPYDGTEIFERSIIGSLQSGVGLLLGCCDGFGTVGNLVWYRELATDGAATYVVGAQRDVVLVRVVLDGELIGSVRPVADPGLPHQRFATIELPRVEQVRGRAVAEFVDARGEVVETARVR
jgi:hypothetical protein